MSTIFSAPSVAQAITGRSWIGGLAATMKRWWRAYMTWRIEQAAIAHLWSMSDRELKDIGLSRSEVTNAVRGKAVRDRALSRGQKCIRL